MVFDPTKLANHSVIEEPTGFGGFGDSMLLQFASVADDLPQWGTSMLSRDSQLRKFWPTENLLASAIFTVASKYASLKYKFTGPERTEKLIDKMFHGFERGQGYNKMMMKVLTDVFTCDNGAFLEIVRAEDSPTSPCITMNHLDSLRCIRTGKWETPVLYQDIHSKYHEMKWYQIVEIVEFPSPIEDYRGLQYCATTRLLRAAQIMRDIAIYSREKVSGRFNRAIHLVSGVQAKQINDLMTQQRATADASGLIRYMQPLVIAGLDPRATIGHVQIDMASLPDGFDPEAAFDQYMNQFALAFGGDRQDFAPLSGGGLGSASQSQTLSMKTRGKGPSLFMETMDHIFNYCGVLPPTVRMTYEEQDIAADGEKQALRQSRAVERDTRLKNGEINVDVARMMAHDVGDLTDEEFELLKNDPGILLGPDPNSTEGTQQPGTTVGGNGVSTTGGVPSLPGKNGNRA